MKSPWLLATIILLLISAALADPVGHDDATTKRQLEFLQKHPYLFPPKGHRSYQEFKRRLGELETVSAQLTTDPNLHASDETRLLTEDKPDRLEEILKEYAAGVYETDDLVVSMLCEGDAASTEKFKCAWDKVEYLLRKDLEATTSRWRLLCSSFPPRRKYCDEYQCWRKNFGPHFEHRVRVFYVVRLARYHARLAGRPAHDYEGIKSSLCSNVFSTEKVERAVKVAQQTTILANAVRYHMVQVLRLLLEEGSRRRLLENESPYEEHYFQILVKEAARGDDLQILEMLLKFSDAPENFGAALLAAVSPGRKKNGQIIHFLLSHEGSMDEALKLAWFKDMVTELEKVQGIYDTYRDSE